MRFAWDSDRPMTAVRSPKIAGPTAQADFLGHPPALPFLFATEMWERFSYYGMRALLVLYMVKYVLQPETAGTVIGLGALKHGLEAVFGPLDIQPLASQIYGLYTGLVYLTPVLGGFLADRVLGQRRTVIIGASLMAIGHFMMAFEHLLLFALALADPRQRRLQAQHVDPGRRRSTRPAIRAATAPIRSSMSASISAPSWRRSCAARWASASAGITASPPPASAC